MLKSYFFVYFVSEIKEINIKIYIAMTKYAGVCAIVFGTLVLVLSYLLDWVDYNWVQGFALVCIIGGLIAHIILSKKAAE